MEMLLINNTPVYQNKYEIMIREFVDKLSNEINSLEQKKKETDEDVRTKLSAKIADLKEKRDELKNLLMEVQDATEEKWDDLREKIDLKVNNVIDEANEIYEGVRNGFSYLFEKVTT